MSPQPAPRGPGKAGVFAALLAGGALAVGIIKPWESPGGEPNLVPYLDIVGVATDCYGNTHGVRMDQARTVDECEALLTAEVRQTAERLSRCIRRELAPNEAAAVLSWAYNVGTGAACGSTLVRQINAGQPASVWCSQLDRWIYAGGRTVQGLANRRKAERAMCEGRHGQAAATAGGLAHAGASGAGRRPSTGHRDSSGRNARGAERTGRA